MLNAGCVLALWRGFSLQCAMVALPCLLLVCVLATHSHSHSHAQTQTQTQTQAQAQVPASAPAMDEWTKLEQQATEHYRSGNHAAALEAAQRTVTLAEREQAASIGTARLASSLNLLALVHQMQGDYTAAQPLLERAVAVAVAIEALPAGHPNIAALQENLAAVEQARREQAVREGLQHVQQLNEQALSHHELGDHEAAAALYVQVLPIIESHFGSQSLEVARVKGSLADAYAARKQYEQAEAQYQQMLQILDQHSDQRIAQSGALSALGVIHYVQRQYGKAQPLFQRALALMEAEQGVDHESLLPMLDNLSTLYRATNRRIEAEPLLRRAAAIRKAQEVKARASDQRSR